MAREDPDELLENLGHRISELRRRVRKTQADVAAALGTGVTDYQRIEHGGQNVTVKTLVRIGGALGFPVAEFFKPTEGPRPRRGRPKGK